MLELPVIDRFESGRSPRSATLVSWCRRMNGRPSPSRRACPDGCRYRWSVDPAARGAGQGLATGLDREVKARFHPRRLLLSDTPVDGLSDEIGMPVVSG